MNEPAFRASPVAVDDYLEGEKSSEIRHEYVDGAVFAMSGASEEHNLIAGNLFFALKAALRGSPCRVFMSDMKTRIQTSRSDRFYYPDLQVTCSDTDRERYFKQQPRLVVEVLSNSTERQDRAEKFHAYRKLDSLEEYMLVAQDARRVELYRRSTGWDLELTEGDGEVYLKTLDAPLHLDAIYEDVFPPADSAVNDQSA